MEMVCFLPLIEHIGCGRGIPDLSRSERRIKIKPNNAFVVHVDGLIDKIQHIGRLVWQLHCGAVAVLEIECRHIFLPEYIVQLRIVLDIWQKLRIADHSSIVIDVAGAAMQLPIRWIDALCAEVELENAFRSPVICGSKLRDEIPVMPVFIMVIFPFRRHVERQPPVKGTLCADVDVRHILVLRVVEVRLVGSDVSLRTMVFGTYIFRTVIHLPFADSVFLVYIHAVTVDTLPVVRTQQIIAIFEKRLRAVFGIPCIVTACGGAGGRRIAQSDVVTVHRRQHSVDVGETAKRAG